MAAFESKKFSWRDGYSYKVSAETVGRVLEGIEKKRGCVTAQDFLDYSRSETAETHSMFEWDDTVAAEKYRLGQSSKIINQIEVKVVREPDDGKELTISAFVNVSPKAPAANATWVNIEKAHGDKDLWHRVMANAMGELKAFKRKYSRYKEFSGVIAEIDKIEEKLETSA